MNTSARSPKKSKGLGKKILFGIAAIGLVSWIVSGLLPKPVPVDVATITRGPLTVSVLEEGKTRIRNRYVISPPVAGYLRRVPVRAGDPVKAGETVLAVIQATPSNFLDPRARAQAIAAVSSAEAAVMQRKELVDTASSELELARKELIRAEQLRIKGAISAQEFDTTANRVDRLESQLGSAQFSYKVGQFELEQAKAVLLQETGDSTESGTPIEIRSPVSGYVLNVMEESARTVTPGLPILEVGDPADLEAEVELLSSDAVNVKPGADVAIEQWGGSTPLPAKVVMVEPGGFLKVSALGVEEQRVKVRVNFVDLPAGVLGDRFRVEARIVTWQGDNVLQVPTGALFRRGNDWMVFRVDNGTARLTNVDIGHTDGISAEVKSGLEENQTVILHPPDTVLNGAAIAPRSN